MARCLWNIQATANLDHDYETYIDGPNGLVAQLGRNFAGIRKNGPYPNNRLSPEFVYGWSKGRTWQYANSHWIGVKWADIAAGQYDADLTSWFETVKGAGMWSHANPLRWSFWHEQSVDNPPQQEGGASAGTADDYKAAHTHVWNLMQPYHVKHGGNMQMVFAPTWAQIYRSPYGVGDSHAGPNLQPYTVEKIDTGLYDMCGADIYLTDKGTNTATQMWTPLHKWALAQGKPFMTGETGIAASKNPPVYLAELDSLLKTWGAGNLPGQVRAICWTSRLVSIGAPGDYRIDASPAILAAYKKLALDPFYGAVAPKV